VENLSWQTALAAGGIRGRLDPVLRHPLSSLRPKELDDADGVKLTVNR